MDREEQIGRGLEEVQLLFQQQSVGAERDELLARDDAFDDLADVLVDQRLAARNGNHRRAALVDRVEAFLHGQTPVEDRVRIVDLAATGAGEIATEQRLKHENERIALAPHYFLLEQIAADSNLLEKWNGHSCLFLSLSFNQGTAASASSAGRRNSIFSCSPGSTEISTGPRRRSAPMTSSTSTSGAEAPAVMPTVPAPRTQAGSNSLPSAIK